jgi:tetratricopeptide (TPR) repeat protein
MRKKLLGILFLTLISKVFLGQAAQNEYQLGVEHLKKGEIKEAKINFRKLILLEPNDYAGYNFLGFCFFSQGDYDSSIVYLKKSIELNQLNNKHSQEMTISRLTNAYLYKKDFKNAYETCLNGLMKFKENAVLKTQLNDICLWSYYIKIEGLDSNYLTTNLLKEYSITNRAQKYMIMRAIKINDHALRLVDEKFNSNDKYDVLTCNVNKTTDHVELKFKLNWDLDKEYTGKKFESESAYKNTENETWVRLGAKLNYEYQAEMLENKMLENKK